MRPSSIPGKLRGREGIWLPRARGSASSQRRVLNLDASPPPATSAPPGRATELARRSAFALRGAVDGAAFRSPTSLRCRTRPAQRALRRKAGYKARNGASHDDRFVLRFADRLHVARVPRTQTFDRREIDHAWGRSRRAASCVASSLRDPPFLELLRTSRPCRRWRGVRRLTALAGDKAPEAFDSSSGSACVQADACGRGALDCVVASALRSPARGLPAAHRHACRRASPERPPAASSPARAEVDVAPCGISGLALDIRQSREE